MDNLINKVKEFLVRLRNDRKLLYTVISLAAVVVVAVVALIVVLCGGVSDDNDSTLPSGKADYTVEVKTEGGMVMSGLDVFVFTDETLNDLFAVDKTDENGRVTFASTSAEGYVAVLKGVPVGYDLAESYAITGETTQIVLKTQLLSNVDLNTASFKLGSVMFDFAVTASDGAEYALSDLLNEKDAVVLNFWYLGCDPCKAEFPYLQEAWDGYSQDVAVLALNPVDGDDASISQYQSYLGLTIPMARVDISWEKAFGITAYPTTVVIDRFGTISLVHKGTIDTTEVFSNVFDFYTAENYAQQTVNSIDDLQSAEKEEGTAANPYEFGGVTEFEIFVEAGQTVYCDVYKISGMLLSIEDAEVSLVYNEEVYKPEKGVLSLIVKAPDTYTPVKLAITNNGSQDKKLKVTFSFLPGTMGNPYTLEMGEFTADISEGNDQGVYYTYTASQSGEITVQCTQVTKDVEYTFTLYNLSTYVYKTLDADGEDNTLTIAVNKGDELQFTAGTLPNDENEYPAAELKFTASFKPGETETTTPTEPSGNTGNQTGTTTPTEPSGNTGSQTGGSTGNQTGATTPTEPSGSTGNQTGTTTPTEPSGNTGSVVVMNPTGKFSAPTLDGSDRKRQDYYDVGEGTFSAAMQADAMTYFVFTPTRAGVYKISATGSTPVVLGNYGGPAYVLASSTVDTSSGWFEYTVPYSYIGDSAETTTKTVIGVYAADKSAGTCTVTIEWVRGVQITAADIDPVAVEFDSTNLVTCIANGEFVDLDVTDDSVRVVRGADGFYYYSDGSVTNKQVYIRLTKESPYLDSLATVSSKTGMYYVHFDASGNAVKKDEYNSMVDAYSAFVNADGVVPLDDNLVGMMQKVGEYMGWWDADNAKGNYLFEDVNEVQGIAWLFACGYYK